MTSLARSLWNDGAELAEACLRHPFVTGIGDGSLSRAAFAYYVGQDAFFLEAFARAYAIAAAKAPQRSQTQTLLDLAGGVLGELQLHGQYAAQWGLDLDRIEAGAATRRYVDFLLATAWGQPIGLTLAAMTPCMRLYAFLGAHLAAFQCREHAYSEWVRTYSSAEFHGLAARLEDLLDACAEDDRATRAAYRYAMACELDFFQAAWQSVP